VARQFEVAESCHAISISNDSTAHSYITRALS
jgi:hypothetical protein